MSAPPLKTLVFLGSARSAAPFFGMLPPRTGDRVLAFAKASIDQLNSAAGEHPLLEVMHVVDILKMPSLLKLDVLNGNPSYYATKDPTSLPDDIAALVRQVVTAPSHRTLHSRSVPHGGPHSLSHKD